MEKSPTKIPLKVFLSYRSDKSQALASLQDTFNTYNQQTDTAYEIELIASELTLKENDNLVDFMGEIGTARFVILLLTNDYFDSPYCLHEMLEIHRNQNAEERIFPLAIKHDEAINKTTTDTIVKGWFENKFCRSRLAELQQSDDSDIKTRLLEADRKLIKPLRDHVIEVQGEQNILKSLLEMAGRIFQEEKEELICLLTSEVTRLLKRISEDDKFSLQNVLKQDFDSTRKIADNLLQKTTEDVMSIMQLWVEARSKEIEERDQNEWRRFFRSVEMICGWLLLKSVDESWWIHNKIHLNSSVKKSKEATLNINAPAYAEVIIGRSVKEAAEYCLNDQHHAFPARFDNVWNNFSSSRDDNILIDEEFVIDASNQAKTEELLIPLLHDLKRKPEKITKDIMRQLHELNIAIRARPKKVYYLVSDRYLQKLSSTPVDDQSILTIINKETAGKLILISYGNSNNDKQMSACQDDEILLAKMADILTINKERTQRNVS